MASPFLSRHSLHLVERYEAFGSRKLLEPLSSTVGTSPYLPRSYHAGFHQALEPSTTQVEIGEFDEPELPFEMTDIHNFNTPPPSGFVLSPGLAPIDYRLAMRPPNLPPDDYFNFASAEAAFNLSVPKFGISSPRPSSSLALPHFLQARPSLHVNPSAPALRPFELDSAKSPNPVSPSPSEDLCSTKSFLDYDDLLALSPQQGSILHAAHQEARKRADSTSSHVSMVTESPSPQQCSPPPLVFQASFSDKSSSTDDVSIMSAGEDSAEMMSPADVTRPPVAKQASESVSPVIPIRPLPLDRPKQLGSLPADEAFASSLDQLKCSNPYKKPPYLWWTLIRAAILGADDQMMQMETLCATIAEKFPYFGTAKESKNWKSSIRSVIHTKPCFYKSEDSAGAVWWHVDTNIDPREQRRGLKKRSNNGELKKQSSLPSLSLAGTYSLDDDDEILGDTDEDAEMDRMMDEAAQKIRQQRKRRKTA